MDISKAVCPECKRQMELRRAVCPDCSIALEGTFEVSALGRLDLADQAFVIAFVRHHGSIKKMESLFEISYPTVKNRLNAIAARLDESFSAPAADAADASPANLFVLERLARGEIDVDEALDMLSPTSE
ncbi:MAG: DUF2089 family protein [Acidobacteriota bacterium]